MKRSIKAPLVALGLILGTLSVCGTTNYWDNNGATAGFGAAGGSWGAEPKWSGDSTGSAMPTVTNTMASDDLHFGTTDSGLAAGTITVADTNQAFRTLTFGAASGEITLAGATLNLAAPAVTVIANNASNTIGCVLAGTNGLNKFGGLSYSAFLSTNWATLFPKATLADYVGAEGMMGGLAIANGPIPASGCFFTNDGSQASCQFQATNGVYTKCVKVELAQSGPDIAARAVYAKYVSGSQLGYDFDKGGTVVDVATSLSVNAYGAARTTLTTANNRNSVLTLTGVNTYSGGTRIGNGALIIDKSGQLGSGAYAGMIVNHGQLIDNSAADQTFSGAISGSGSLVKGLPFSYETVTYSNFLKAAATVIISNATLTNFAGAHGKLGGKAFRSGAIPAYARFFANGGATATFQLQAVDDIYTKCVKVELTQSGADIAARAVYAKYVAGSQLGFDFDKGGTAVAIVSTTNDASGYGVPETTLTTYPTAWLKLSGTSSYAGGTVINSGVLEASATSNALPSAGGITVNRTGELMLKAGDLASTSAGGVGNGNPITVNSGGTLTLVSQYNAGYSRPITIDGGTLNCTVTVALPAGAADSGNYVNNLTLKNGARVTGSKLRMGNGALMSARIAVSGTQASSIEAGLSLVKNGTETLTFDVADATGDPEPDLFIPGIIRDYPNLTGLPIVKTGAGTMSFSGTNTHFGPFTVTGGTFALGAHNTLNDKNDIVLNGGTLDMGSFSNSVGALTLKNTSEIVLGEGRLAFANSSGKTWTKSLMLTGVLDRQTMRFGTNVTGLTSSQISSIILNGKHVRITDDGYLAPGLKGTVIWVY